LPAENCSLIEIQNSEDQLMRK